MFFLVERKDRLALHPRHYTSSLSSLLLSQLRAKVEGKCTGRYGYTILVTMMREVGAGVLDPDTGYAHFPVSYLALVFRPFKNEVLVAKVTTVNNVRAQRTTLQTDTHNASPRGAKALIGLVAH